MYSAKPEAVPQARGIIATQQLDEPALVALDALPLRHNTGGLETQVPHAVEHRREHRHPDGDHNAFQVDAIAYVGGAPGHM